MFRSTRANARRISLLASSSFLASTLMAGAGGMALTAMTPVIALANPVCNTGAPDGTYAAPAASAGTFTCGPGPAASLGFTSATGTNLYTSGNLVVNAGGLKVISTGNGIIVIEQSPVTVTSGGFINATGSGEDGIYAKSAGGNVTVINGTTAVPFAVTGDDYGLYAETTCTATVSVTAASNVTGVLKSGIIAYTGSGLSTETGITLVARLRSS